MLSNRPLTTIVFFLDETFEEVAYDICTSIQEATEQLAATIKLQNYSTFTIFDCRKVLQMLTAGSRVLPVTPSSSTTCGALLRSGRHS